MNTAQPDTPCDLLHQQYLQRLPGPSRLQNWHEFWLYRCLDLALYGLGRVAPNPLVGALIVRPRFSAALPATRSAATWQNFIDSPQTWPALPAGILQEWDSYFELLGQGYHAACGQLHAEAAAFADARARGYSDFGGSILYCNLEPCCFHATEKRQPPCSEKIAQHKLSAVVFANVDPNPAVSGGGALSLRNAGLTVRSGDLAKASTMINHVYFRHMQNLRNSPSAELGYSPRPWISLKLAQSLDGRIATKSGHSQWISGPRARSMVQALRAHCGAAHSAVAVGRGTLEADNPNLLLRPAFLAQLAKGAAIPLSLQNQQRLEQEQPWRIVWDSQLRSSRCALQFYCGAQQNRSIAIHCQQATTASDLLSLEQTALSRIPVQAPLHSIKGLCEGLEALSKSPFHIKHLLLEGGATLASSFLAAGLVDEVYCFISQRFIGAGLNALGDLFPSRQEVTLGTAPQLFQSSSMHISEKQEAGWKGPDELLCHGYLRPIDISLTDDRSKQTTKC